jgi:antitoxin HicB
MYDFTYRAKFEPGDRRGVVVVSFPDVPEAITEGRGETDARTMAEEALGLTLLTYVQLGKPLPKAKAKTGAPITVAPEVALKLAVLMAFNDAAMTKSEFARRLKKTEKEARRILDPKHPTKLGTLSAALKVLGKRIVVSVAEAA